MVDSNNSSFDFGNNIEYDKETTPKKTLHGLRVYYELIIVGFLYRKVPALRHVLQYLNRDLNISYTKIHLGIMEYIFECQHNSNTLLYHLPQNLWFEYELEGDYRDKVKTIELRRRFVKIIYDFGVYDQQDGWNLIFKFKGIPMHGKCIIRYT